MPANEGRVGWEGAVIAFDYKIDVVHFEVAIVLEMPLTW
jgi:hypothetical protein